MFLTSQLHCGWEVGQGMAHSLWNSLPQGLTPVLQLWGPFKTWLFQKQVLPSPSRTKFIMSTCSSLFPMLPATSPAPMATLPACTNQETAWQQCSLHGQGIEGELSVLKIGSGLDLRQQRPKLLILQLCVCVWHHPYFIIV